MSLESKFLEEGLVPPKPEELNVGGEVERVIERKGGRLIDNFLIKWFSDPTIATPEQGGSAMLELFPKWQASKHEEIWTEGTPYDLLDSTILDTIKFGDIAEHTRVKFEAISKVFKNISRRDKNHNEIGEQVNNWKFAHESTLEALEIQNEGKATAEFSATLLRLREEYKKEQEDRIEAERRMLEEEEIQEFFRSHFEKELFLLRGYLSSDKVRARRFKEGLEFWKKKRALALRTDWTEASIERSIIVKDIDLLATCDYALEQVSKLSQEHKEAEDSKFKTENAEDLSIWIDRQRIALLAVSLEEKT